MAASVYSVTQVNNYIKNMFNQDFLLNRISVKGEVSNCKYHGSGHIYFTLKEGSTATLTCVMFAGNRRGRNFDLKAGQNIIVDGTVTVYERDGKYQLYAKSITLDGVGALYQQYEELKNRLEEMGMFAKEYKRPIPRYVKKVGIVTSRTGAAVHDIINISTRRNPYVQLILYPAQVQGEGASRTIVAGIEALDRLGVDVIIVGRGGGSIEDLWAFNEEAVAMAVFNCSTPVISAVGHETDFTIIDFVADMRAPTPSAAAELAVYDYRIFKENLDEYNRRLLSVVRGKYDRLASRLEQYKIRVCKYNSPSYKLIEKRKRLLDIEDELGEAMKRKLKDNRQKLMLVSEKLNGLSPLRQLARGYSYVTKEEDKGPLTSIKNVSVKDGLTIRLSDGSVNAVVTDVKAIKE